MSARNSDLGSLLLVERQTDDAAVTQYKQESYAPSLLAIHGSFCGAATLTVVLRLYVRIFILKSIGPDDYLIAAADVFSIGVLICFIGEDTTGGLGRHPSLLSSRVYENFEHWRFYHSLIVMIGISLVKISIACFLRRFVAKKNYQRFLVGLIVFLVAFTISCGGTLIFNCGSRPDANWNFALRTNGEAKCFKTRTFNDIGIFNSSINIATDVLLALLPVPIVWNLQTNRRTKFTLIIILSLGLFACAASIVKTVYQTHVGFDPDWSYHDRFFMWNNIEFNIGIIAASLPALRPLFTKILGAAHKFTSSSSRNRQKHGDGYDADGLAYHHSNNRASRNPAGHYRQFGSTQSSELKELPMSGGASSDDTFGNDGHKVQGVTSTVTAGDDQSDRVLLSQDYNAVLPDKGLASPPGHTIIQTTTVQIARY